MVAYLLIQKRQRKKKSEAEIPTKINDLQDKPKIIESVTQEKEDFIGPLDFGHGRFCICQDCRKGLALSGNFKNRVWNRSITWNEVEMDKKKKRKNHRNW